MAKQWFISDLHLSTERPETLQLFERFLHEEPASGDKVYILGDLFDVWIGDDDDTELAERGRAALRQASERGVKVLIQRGNRDFAIGKQLMRDTGASLLPDRVVTTVAQKATLLLHGDLLCTDDIGYQKARRRFRNPLFRWFMLRKPLQERRRIAAEIRRRSGEAKALKSEDIMDVNPSTVLRYLQRYRVQHMIHGHTHRPALHELKMPDGSDATRLVLPEWHGDQATAWVDDGLRLQTRQIGLG